MHGNSAPIKFDDSILPTAASEVVLYSSIKTFALQQYQQGGVKKIVGNITSDQAGTLRLESSHDGGITPWVVVSTALAVTPLDFDFEYLIEHYDSFRLVYTCGGADQTAWHVNLAFTNERAHSKNGTDFH